MRSGSMSGLVVGLIVVAGGDKRINAVIQLVFKLQKLVALGFAVVRFDLDLIGWVALLGNLSARSCRYGNYLPRPTGVALVVGRLRRRGRSEVRLRPRCLASGANCWVAAKIVEANLALQARSFHAPQASLGLDCRLHSRLPNPEVFAVR
jgi:hypothetical protein